MTGYCLRCRESREIQEVQHVTLKNGRRAAHGHCGDVWGQYVQASQILLKDIGAWKLPDLIMASLDEVDSRSVNRDLVVSLSRRFNASPTPWNALAGTIIHTSTATMWSRVVTPNTVVPVKAIRLAPML